MNKNLIIGIITLTSIALLALIGLQFVWINNAISLREKNFIRSVDKTIENVIEELEKKETENIIRKRFGMDSQSLFYSNKLDSISYLFLKELDSIPWSEDMREKDMNASGENVRIEITRDENNRMVKRMLDVKDNSVDNLFSSKRYISISDKISDDEIKNLNKQFKEVVENSYRIQDIFNDLFSLGAKQVIEKRISAAYLDSIIYSSLLRRNLDTNYQFAVYSSERNLTVLKKNVEDIETLYDKGFSYRLFPRDTFMSPDYLTIYFPKQKTFLLNQMQNMIFTSILIFALVLIAFIYTIQTILKQKKLSEMKNDFINNMTHEFKTPISTISLACEALSDNDIRNTQEVQESYINIISEENKRLGLLAEKILQTSIIEKSEMSLKNDTVDMHQVIKDAIAINRMQVEIKDGVIKTELNAEKFIVNGDFDHLVNVISNLLDNANKYTPKKPIIVISTKNDKKQIEISVKDNGIGISKANKKRIFEKLYRVPTGDIHNVKGFGLGLSYVKFIVDAHRGTIMVDSDINQGSVFTIILPLK